MERWSKIFFIGTGLGLVGLGAAKKLKRLNQLRKMKKAFALGRKFESKAAAFLGKVLNNGSGRVSVKGKIGRNYIPDVIYRSL